jgi:hypothetical protein
VNLGKDGNRILISRSSEAFQGAEGDEREEERSRKVPVDLPLRRSIAGDLEGKPGHTIDTGEDEKVHQFDVQLRREG